MKPTLLLRLLSLAALVATAACSKSQDKVTIDLHRPSGGTPVATYKGGVLTSDDVNSALAQLPPMVRMRYQTPAQKKELVEKLVTLDLLAREAIRTGHANDPEVVEMLKNVLAQRVVKEERENKAPPVTDEEVQAWYDTHTADFTRPETWRLSTLFIAVPENDPAKQKVQQAKAEKLLAQAQKLKPDDFAAFGQLVKANSDDPSKAMEGDLRALTAVELSSRYGTDVAKAGEALTTPGQLSGLVHTRTGVHILKLRAHTASAQATLPEVKAQIRTRLQNEHRNQAYEKFISDLKANANVKVDEAALAKVLVEGAPHPTDAPSPRALGPLPVPMPGPAPAATPPPARP